MGLKQDIVVVNEYTIQNKSKHGGSRGGTPGDYVLRYMSRDNATELATPITLNNEDYIVRYMARKEASEIAGSEEEMQRYINDAQKLGGVAFSRKTLSLSHTDLIRSSKEIQTAFDSGKTVMKTVISFTEDYLRDNGILSDGFVFTNRGDFRGNIDQMKLRYAIANGMEYLSREYEDLQYVGVIQVDTAHVHCHLAMVDMGDGNVMPDGTQRGKLPESAKAKIRRGIDMALDEAKEVQYMASNVGIDKRNLQTNLKKYTYEQVVLYGTPQRILSVLPEDERLWRASTNRKEMKTANKICRDYVEDILERPDSGMIHAMTSIRNYAETRAKREDLSLEQKEKLVVNGRNTLVESCMNSIYSTLKQIPKSQRTISTPFLDLTSQTYLAPSHQNDIQDFVYKMNAYSSRFSKHRKETKKYAGFVQDYELSKQAGNAVPDSVVLYDFFKVELEYHKKVASKYSQFLFMEEPTDDLANEYLALAKRARQVKNMELLGEDASVCKMKPNNAENYGRDCYDTYGGRYLILDPETYYKRLDKLKAAYHTDNDAFHSKLEASNLQVFVNENGNPVIKRVHSYPFDAVKGLDLQDLRGDFSEALEFDDKVKQDFMNMAHRRIEAYDAACEYLDRTGQSALKSVFDASDVEGMRSVMIAIQNAEPVTPIVPMQFPIEHKRVIPLDNKMHRYLSNMVKQNAQQFEAIEAMNLSNNRELE